METQKNLLEIIEKCPKETVFYCPLIGECTVEIDQDGKDFYPLKCVSTINPHEYRWLTKEGKCTNIVSGKCVLFPSKDQRDWSKFGIPKPDLPIGTLVAVSMNGRMFEIGTYVGNGYARYNPKADQGADHWRFIVPLDKLRVGQEDHYIFNEEDNYGRE